MQKQSGPAFVTGRRSVCKLRWSLDRVGIGNFNGSFGPLICIFVGVQIVIRMVCRPPLRELEEAMQGEDGQCC